VTQSRVLVIAAIAGGALYLAGAIALGTPPHATDSGGQVVSWLADHSHSVRLYAWTFTFGTLAFAVVAAILRQTLPSPHRDVFFFGTAAFVIETALQAWIWAGLALHPGALSASIARSLLDVALYWGPILTGTTMTMIAAVTVLGFGATPLIPRWLTVFGLVAFAEQAIETVTVFGTHGFVAPGGDMNVLLGAALTAIWLGGFVVWGARKLSE
jgi:hypothetical protein